MACCIERPMRAQSATWRIRMGASFCLETVLACMVVFCPNGRWRHLACCWMQFEHWETVAACMSAKMNSQRRSLNLLRQFRHSREGELHEETVQLDEMVFASSSLMWSSSGGHTFMCQVPPHGCHLSSSLGDDNFIGRQQRGDPRRRSSSKEMVMF